MTERFDVLVGKTIRAIEGAEKGSEIIRLITDGGVFVQQHYQDCCESVLVEDVCGNIEDIIGNEVLDAWESSSEDDSSYGHATWTFYTIRTQIGTLVIRWYGESNGYYSEDVSFSQEEG